MELSGENVCLQDHNPLHDISSFVFQDTIEPKPATKFSAMAIPWQITFCKDETLGDSFTRRWKGIYLLEMKPGFHFL